MDWVECESFGLFCPCFGDELVGRQALEGLQSSGEVVSVDEVCEVGLQLLVCVVVVAFDGRFLDRAVHSLDLSVGPGMVDFGEAMLDAVLAASWTCPAFVESVFDFTLPALRTEAG